jgi:hypothetical protein
MDVETRRNAYSVWSFILFRASFVPASCQPRSSKPAAPSRPVRDNSPTMPVLVRTRLAALPAQKIALRYA